MGEKIKFALKKSKAVLIVVMVLWVLLSIVLIAPISVSVIDSTVNGKISIEAFFENMFGNITNVSSNLGKIFTKNYIKTFFKGELYLTIALFFFSILGIIKTIPKHDYTNIEHGSSDWSNGEEYSILSRNKGIILAEKHYLPVDKRGNVNVLVVGRFRFW